MNKLVFVFVFMMIVLGFVSGAEVDNSILKKFDDGSEKVSVIVEKNSLQENMFMRMSDNGIEKIAERGNRYVAFVTEEELKILEKDSSVLSVQRNIPLKIFMQDSVGIVGANESWSLKVGDVNLTGISQSVCILDSGIDSDHPDFSGRILAEKCYCTVSDSGSGGCCPDGTGEDNNASDDNGHGTHVAGIVGASGGINGIATDVGLVVVKIMNSTGDGSSFDMEDGIQWCIDNAATYNISVITASLGAASKQTGYCDDDAPSTTAKINSAVLQNISVTIASGNNGWNDGITWPSCISNATPVGAVNKANSLYYNRNSLLKLLGIGILVNSTSYSGGYEIRSGTSMATPMVAGAVSVLNQVLNLTGQQKTPSEIEDIFYNTGYVVSELGNDYSRINIYEAILSVDNIEPNVSLVSPSDNHVNLTTNQTFVCNVTDWQLVNMTFSIWNSSGLYYNESVNFTGEFNESSFSLTDIPKGEYEWNCLVFDNQSNFAYASSNFTLTIGGVEVDLISPENNTYTNVNNTNFTCVSYSDSNYSLVNVTFSVWNSSDDLIYNLTEDISGSSNESIFNYTFVDEGEYLWECLAINNNSNEGDGINYTVTYDVTFPNISSLSVGDIGSSGATITWETNEVANSSISTSSGSWSNSSNYQTSHSIVVSGLSASTSYNYNVLSCDRAGNCNSSVGSFTTGAATSTGNPGGSTSTSSNTVSSTSSSTSLVHDISSSEVSKGYTKRLKVNERLNFSIFDFSGGRHLLTVVNVGDDYVNLTIESDPINLTLGLGQSTKLNLTSPNYYDLFVKLNNITSDGAELMIQLINEPIVSNVIEKEIIKEKVVNGKNYFWVVIVLVVVLVAIVFVVIVKNRKKLKGKDTKKKGGKRKSKKTKT